MADAFVAERAKVGTASASTLALSYSGVTAGNLLVLGVGYGGSGLATRDYSSVSDSGSNTWSIISHAVSGTIATSTGCALLYCVAVAASGTVTVTFTGSAGAPSGKIEEFSGLSATPLDTGNTNGANAAATSGTTPSVTPAAANELAVVIFTMGHAEASFTTGSIGGVGSTQAGTTINGANSGDIGFEYVLSGASGAQTGAGSWPTSAGWGSGLAFFKLAAAGASSHLLALTGVGL